MKKADKIIYTFITILAFIGFVCFLFTPPLQTQKMNLMDENVTHVNITNTTIDKILCYTNSSNIFMHSCAFHALFCADDHGYDYQ